MVLTLAFLGKDKRGGQKPGMNVPTRGKVGIWRAGCMFSVVTLFVWGENIVCFLAKDCLKKRVPMPEKMEKVPDFVQKRPVFADFSLFSVPKCGF